MAVYAGPEIVTNGLVLALDAGNTQSYPGSGTTWTDLSRNGNNGTLTNGPTFGSDDRGSIVFDGTNDYVLVPSNASSIPYGSAARTVSIWFYTNTTTWVDDVNNLFFYGSGSTGSAFGIDMRSYPAMEVFTWGGAGRDIGFNTTFSSQVGWKNICVTYNGSTTILIYENGILTQTLTLSSPANTTTSDVYIGAINPSVVAGYYYDGRISNTLMYNRALSAAEVQQNYNALKSRFPISPTIVTDGLVLNLDAGNNLSYPDTGTTWTDLSGNGNNGTLTNGPTYSSANGGAIVFDGVNDFIDFTSDTNLLPTTGLSVSAWFKTSVADMWLVGKTSISTSNGYLLAGTGVGGVSFQVNGIGATSTASITNNSWIYVVGTWTPSTSILLYRNGSLIVTNTTSIPASIIEPSYTVEVGRRPNGPDYWNGSIAQVSIYNRALSADEVAQNFNATRGRFGI